MAHRKKSGHTEDWTNPIDVTFGAFDLSNYRVPFMSCVLTLKQAADYLKLVTDEMIPKVAELKLAEFCDVFVEDSAFSIEEGRSVREAGKKQVGASKMQADQVSYTGGATLSA